MILEVGTEAPQFCLPNSDDIEVCLNNFPKQWIVLYFYPKDDTPGCTTEACDFTNEFKEFQNLGATIIGISPDSPEKHRKFIEKHNLGITLLSDEEKSVLKDYGAWGMKKNFGKEYEGVIRSTYIISPEGKVAHTWKNVRVKGHVEIVKKRLQKLQEEK
jgi:peroxiredoxin Q/BCP